MCMIISIIKIQSLVHYIVKTSYFTNLHMSILSWGLFFTIKLALQKLGDKHWLYKPSCLLLGTSAIYHYRAMRVCRPEVPGQDGRGIPKPDQPGARRRLGVRRPGHQRLPVWVQSAGRHGNAKHSAGVLHAGRH